MAETLDVEQVRTVLAAACQAVIDARDDLAKADRAIGDGDHGSGMARGFGAAHKAVLAADLDTIGDAFKVVGTAVLSTSGGASGPVFGTMFRAPAKALTEATLDAEAYAVALEQSAQQVMARSKAEPGQKTMLDALVPAAEAANTAVDDGLEATTRAAADAAAAGSRATEDMVAQVGKAKSLGERSLSHPDPGSISVAILLGAIADGVQAAGAD